MKPIPHRHHAAGKREIRRRLDHPVTAPTPDPVFTASNIHYDVASRTRAISCGGIGAIQLLVRKLSLAEAIDQRLHCKRIADYTPLDPGTNMSRDLASALIRG